MESQALEGSLRCFPTYTCEVGNAMNDVHNVYSSQIITELSDKNSPTLPITNLLLLTAPGL
ncbi:hypothetical protein IHE45_07G061000 [Dioscorea alata]|uniref:Uncharacterized protein n=1 Tax=Dioscorea alata TaxID=55571 RepID=A0ACB7VRL8_DIOAL|nr:hypothetical protein IHE45_07G061000 [Dioscorea alata]